MAQSKLSAKGMIYARNYGRTGDGAYAAHMAGFTNAQVAESRARYNPAMQREIIAEQQALLVNDLLPAAVHCLKSIMVNESAPAGARVQAAKVVFERTIGAQQALEGKEPHEMTGAELAAAIDKLVEQAAGDAKDITPKTVEPVAAKSEPGGGVFD